MSQQYWTLQSVEQNLFLDSFEFAESLESPETSETIPCYLRKYRLQGGLSDGVEMIDLDNGCISLQIMPTRGMGIWRGRCGDVELKWDSPVQGPVHPQYVPCTDPGGLGWLEGFDEWLVRCGLESNGSPDFDPATGRLRYQLHGRIANLPTRELSFTANSKTGEMTLQGKVFESKLFFKKLELDTCLTTYAGSSEFIIRDTITNLSAEPGEFQLLYHINTGLPFAMPHGRVVVPFDRMAPRTDLAAAELDHWNRLDPETPGSGEVVYFFEPAVDANGQCKALLVNPAGDRGLTLSFSKRAFPFFCVWKSRLKNGDGYVCGMEPATNFPNTKTFEKSKGRVVPLRPNESRSFELRFEILLDADSVRAAEKEIGRISAKGVIEPKPLADWSE